jgi:hypothetical protein
MGAALSTAIVASGAIRALDATREDEVGVPAAVWYARPVLLVSDVQVALRFYLDTLGFTRSGT